LQEPTHWAAWGPYLAERAWGTVREDYSATGDAWGHLTHDEARSRAYRWNEDGLGGVCDSAQRLCLAVCLWNGRDPILKERLFGLSGPEGNHGEDVKEEYHYLDALPSHAWLHMCYRYPQRPFPYDALVRGNATRDRHQPELELLDTDAFEGSRYFDVHVRWAKADAEDLLCWITATNRGPEAADLHLLPTAWFRNTWTWRGATDRPTITLERGAADPVLHLVHPTLGERWLYGEAGGVPLFTENDTNTQRLYGVPPAQPWVKDAFHRHIVDGEPGAINPACRGTKAALHHRRTLAPGEAWTIRLRLSPRRLASPFDDAEAVRMARESEADAYWRTALPAPLGPEARRVARQALAGMIWTKQFYHYDVATWLRGDPAMPAPPPGRGKVRNGAWQHMRHADVLSMPDAWEYPWYAGWDLAFHCLPLALIDGGFAKAQLRLLLSDGYQGPDGQVPAYEWNFSDTNPPVLAMAALEIYRIERASRGVADIAFLREVFHKLLLQFTWWVNRKDAQGNHLYEGGFLGLDNIGVFDRSRELPTGGHIEQADGSAWMAMFALDMLNLALTLGDAEPGYVDMASRFLEHFARIAHAVSEIGADGISLWDEAEGFFHDVLTLPDGRHEVLRVRSMVGLVPLFATTVLPPDTWERHPMLASRVSDLRRQRPELAPWLPDPAATGAALVSLVPPERLRRLLSVMLDEDEFLSPHGIRSLSRRHAAAPYTLTVPGGTHVVRYEPAESTTGMFGGNSNWRGPVWFPMNHLVIRALRTFDQHLGPGWQVPCPSRSGPPMRLSDVADELSHRLTRLFLHNAAGSRPCFGRQGARRRALGWQDDMLFHEYFHGDTGEGLGATHQTGWTGLVANMLVEAAGREPR
jgi:hypothetical protein